MIGDILQETITVLTIALVIRSLLSWFPNIDRRNFLVDFLITVTDPILVPIRSVMPRTGMFDLTPMIAVLLLQFVARPLVAAIFV